MAAFSESELDRVDWSLLQNGSVNLYWRSDVLDADLMWLENHAYDIDKFDCSTWGNEGDLHKALKKQLNFPDYYGGSLNALNDVLSDIRIPEESGRALVFRRFDSFNAQFPKLAWQFLDILDLNSQRAALFGRRLIALLQSDDPRITFEPVGARPVLWNRKESLNKSRGL